jgi:hypothetical protein
MDSKSQDDRKPEAQQSGRTANESLNRPDHSINPNGQRERERERGAEDEGHFGDGQERSGRSGQEGRQYP